MNTGHRGQPTDELVARYAQQHAHAAGGASAKLTLRATSSLAGPSSSTLNLCVHGNDRRIGSHVIASRAADRVRFAAACYTSGAGLGWCDMGAFGRLSAGYVPANCRLSLWYFRRERGALRPKNGRILRLSAHPDLRSSRAIIAKKFFRGDPPRFLYRWW